MDKELEDRLDDCYQRHFGNLHPSQWKDDTKKFLDEIKQIIGEVEPLTSRSINHDAV